MSSEENAKKVLFTFLGEYLMMCNKSRGYEKEPDFSTQIPITFGREKLVEAYELIDSVPGAKVRDLVNQAEADFELSYRSPVIDDNGNFAESRAQARMWLGITQSILGKVPQSLDLDSPQTQGPGLAFAESASLFLGLGDFLLAGRVIQEWSESLLYAGNDQDAFNLFTIAMLTFEFSGEKERGAVVRNRVKNMQPSQIDSAFLARGQVPGQEQMTTVLGCRNTTKLRKVCINNSHTLFQFQQTQPVKKRFEVKGFQIQPGAKLTGADLSNSELIDANLTDADLTGADLTGADLTGADLSNTILTDAKLTGANLSNAKLSRVWLHGADLTGADLSNTNLNNANLVAAKLTGANLADAKLILANLTYADLTGADLSNTILTNADLSNTILTDAKLTDANLSNAKLTGAKLTGAKLTGAIMPDGTIHN